MYLLLPPMLALLFYAFADRLRKHDLFGLAVIVAMLLVFEAEKGFWFGSTVLFFTLVSHYFLPKIEQIVQCRICLAAIYTTFAYPGYWLFVWLTDQVLLLTLPVMDWHIAMYMMIEFLMLTALV